MNFDPTISLDLLVIAGGVALFVIRMQTQMSANSRDIKRTGELLDKLEARVAKNEDEARENQRLFDRHLGAAGGGNG